MQGKIKNINLVSFSHLFKVGCVFNLAGMKVENISFQRRRQKQPRKNKPSIIHSETLKSKEKAGAEAQKERKSLTYKMQLRI